MIFISPYLKGREEKGRLARRTEYIATREGVELLEKVREDKPPSKKQQEYIRRLLDSFPLARELGEYEDYAVQPTKRTASEFIDQVLEQFIVAMDQRENFLDYVAHRPGVKAEGDHGLWNSKGRVPDLQEAIRSVAHHEGNIWTPVVSLRREDAERLGFTNAEDWRTLVCSCQEEIAKGYKIKPQNLRWFAALHEKEKHYHIHMIVYSSDPKEGYLTKQGIRDIKAAFARQIFAQDLEHVYERKTEFRNEVQRSAADRMAGLIEAINTGTIISETLFSLTEELAKRLNQTKGRKVYGYLPPQVKSIVDAIVDELARDARVANAYSCWQDMRDEVFRTYSEILPERLPLSRQKEFKPVRNMVIREALKLSLQTQSFEDEDMEDEPAWEEESKDGTETEEQVPIMPKRKRSVYDQAARYRRAKQALCSESTNNEEQRDALSVLETLWLEGYAIAAHQLGKAYRDGLGTEEDIKKACEWFQLCAEKGYDCSAYALGKLQLEQGDADRGIDWLRRAATQGNQFAQYRLGKSYLLGECVPKDVQTAMEYFSLSAEKGNQFAQYTLGKLYLQGREIPQEKTRAVDYLSRAAAQGNPYAQFFLQHVNDIQNPSVSLTVLRMFRHMAQIFRDSSAARTMPKGIQIDRKRRRQLQEKRIALGHKPDDHEDNLQDTYDVSY